MAKAIFCDGLVINDSDHRVAEDVEKSFSFRVKQLSMKIYSYWSTFIEMLSRALYLSRDMTKPTMWLCAQRRLRSAWASAQSDQSSLCAQWVVKDPSFLHANSKDSDWTGRMPRLIWVFAGRTFILLVLSRGGSLRVRRIISAMCAR